eukprot:1961961-Rhodomonas_salina.4
MVRAQTWPSTAASLCAPSAPISFIDNVSSLNACSNSFCVRNLFHRIRSVSETLVSQGFVCERAETVISQFYGPICTEPDRSRTHCTFNLSHKIVHQGRVACCRCVSSGPVVKFFGGKTNVSTKKQ